MELILAAAIALVIVLFFWLLRGVMLTPVRAGRGVEISITISAAGEAPSLEETVDGVCWLVQNGTLPARLVLRDEGMTAEARARAELLAKDLQTKLE